MPGLRRRPRRGATGPVWLNIQTGLVKLNNRSGKSGGDSRLDTPTTSARDATHPGTQKPCFGLVSCYSGPKYFPAAVIAFVGVEGPGPLHRTNAADIRSNTVDNGGFVQSADRTEWKLYRNSNAGIEFVYPSTRKVIVGCHYKRIVSLWSAKPRDLLSTSSHSKYLTALWMLSLWTRLSFRGIKPTLDTLREAKDLLAPKHLNH